MCVRGMLLAKEEKAHELPLPKWGHASALQKEKENKYAQVRTKIAKIKLKKSTHKKGMELYPKTKTDENMQI